MQALFKARFEQALDSQKLNIKKIEQQLRRKGVNPEDPIAMASIQRVASTFFRAIDEKQGTPYVFRGDRQPTASDPSLDEANDDQLPADLSPDDSDQEELDRFIAEIEDAADQECAEEEAAEREEASRIRYWDREDALRMRGRDPNWRSENYREDHCAVRGNKPRTMEIRKWDSGDDDVSDASEGDDLGDESDDRDARIKLARIDEASGESDGEILGGSEGDELWESENEEIRDTAGRTGKKSNQNIDENWDSD